MIRVQQMRYRANVFKEFDCKQITTKPLDSRNPRLWWGQVAAGACKDGPCPERVYHSRPYCQALSDGVLKMIEAFLLLPDLFMMIWEIKLMRLPNGPA